VRKTVAQTWATSTHTTRGIHAQYGTESAGIVHSVGISENATIMGATKARLSILGENRGV
jgi:hypothetical protein